MSDLTVEKGQDDNLWISSITHGVAICVVREVEGKFFAAEDDSFTSQIGPFDSLDSLVTFVEENKSFSPWF